MLPFFSIIIPVYNVEKYLPQCVDSVIKQNFKEIEIILINDGSPDLCPQICNDYARDYDYIKVIHKQNGGLSDARNIGISEASGQYLVFIDSDDWLNKNALNFARKSIEDHFNPDILMNRIMIYEDDTHEERECLYYFDQEKLKNKNTVEVYEICSDLPEFWASAWMFIVNREYLLKHKLYFVKGLLHEDEQWSPKLILNSNSIGFNNHCFYYARGNRLGSITYSTNVKRELDKLLIIDDLYKESQKEQYDEMKKLALKRRCSSLFVGVFVSAFQYKSINKEMYNLVIAGLTARKHILIYGLGLKYRMLYVACLILGTKNAIELVYKTNIIKSMN